MRAALVTLITACLLIPAMASAQNRPPIADAGPDQSVFTNESTTLQGSAIDPDNDPIEAWQWTIESAPAGSTPFLPLPDRQSTQFIGDVAGDYVISLIASDGLVWSEPDFVTVTVADLLPPVAVADATPTSGTAPLVVQFDASQSYDPQGGTLSYYWTFGDFSDPSVEVSPSHTYTAPGTYVAFLNVVDDLGQSATAAIAIEVEEPGNTAPVASPSATPNSGSAPLSVQFAANASDADGDALSYAWDFGDGETSTNEAPLHTYLLEDIYTVSLVVDDGTDTATNDLTIVVGPPLTINAGDPDFGLGPDGFGVPLSGPSNIPVTIIIKTNLLDSPWTPLHACDLTNGAILFTDPGWTNRPAGFYRVRSP